MKLDICDRTLKSVVQELQEHGLELKGCTGRSKSRGRTEWLVTAHVDRVAIQGCGYSIEEAVSELLKGRKAWQSGLS